ncbi:SAM-dependent methyltransferase [Streptomyces platensis]|uniref:SAM-dependent methyltransferase n=1 Tax=Streptomyces platensis TaxID=58346 RepID=UPI002258812F|nr:SAM-dependent methyltransferase [Streptomyces platensis]MCX4638507.1 SAM-dependent methyltransferase [Streptomyces platensis]
MSEHDSVVDLQLDRAHSSRIYDYFLGGKTNFLADRMAAGSVLSVFPAALAAARINREFMHRATRVLAAAGLRQFLDIGTGIPTPPNLHDIAQGTAPDARVVYTDNDPIVLAHAAALLIGTAEGRTAYVQADVNDPEGILTAPQLLDTLDLTRPVALSLNALMHFVPDDGEDRAHTIVETLKAALPSGSTLALSHATPDFSPEAMRKIIKIYGDAGTRLQFRSRAEVLRFFDGWELLEPGLTLPHQWRPERPEDAGHVTDAEAACYAGVARKP